jgi:hypothetical protein
MTAVNVDVHEVREIIFYGSTITTEPQYEKTYNLDLAKKLDAAIYAALGEG